MFLAGCYEPHLGAAPFACAAERGLCPAGYRCVQALCLADGQPDPPLLIAVTDSGNAPPQPVWDGQRFAVFWQQPGVGLRLGLGGGAPAVPLSPLQGDVAFASLYHAGTGRFVAAVRRNDDAADDELRVVSVAPGDPAPRTELACSARSPFGFSAPSLSPAGPRAVTVAYTRIVEPAIHWTRLDLAAAPAPGCQPRVTPTPGHPYAVEVTVAEAPDATLLFWRDNTILVTRVLGGVEQPPSELPFLHVARAVVHGPSIGIAAQRTPLERSEPPWLISLSTFREMQPRPEQPIPSVRLVPDLVADGERFAACTRGDDGELLLTFIRADTLARLGSARVARLSRAEIASCRLAAAPAAIGLVAVAWQERIPPSTFREYVAVVRAIPR